MIAEFIKKNWSRIWNAAKSYGKIAWYRAHLCITGATVALFNKYRHNVSMLVLALQGNAYEKGEAIWAAAKGCYQYAK